MTTRLTSLAAAGLLTAAIVVGAACGGDERAEAQTTPAPTRTLTLEQAVGQRLVTGYRGAKPTVSVLKAVREGRVGGVILFADNVPTVAKAKAAITLLQQAAASLDQPPLLVMIDQEGGDVKRIPSFPPTMTPARMGISGGPASTAEGQGLATGTMLRSIGVNVDLAPVADVPDAKDSFLGKRAFSRNPKTAAVAACGFVDGLQRASVAGTLKHFPGLGRARGNTDLQRVRVAATGEQLTADLAPYDRCAARASLVMMSSATYPALGLANPAVLDPKAYALLGQRGFAGLTISDAFDTPAINGRKDAAVRATKAGLDLLLYGQNERGARLAYERLLVETKAGRLDPAAAQATAAGVVALKDRLAAG
ncbi:MAG: glycoside hydrolase family 3 N-terminal domain-containing protein [Solirubrobacteraceae bacterium]|nr:glycoside hydrolase family 3 N-terminal domain-containing protein [Solirubrobacteraceae bacterium]